MSFLTTYVSPTLPTLPIPDDFVGPPTTIPDNFLEGLYEITPDVHLDNGGFSGLFQFILNGFAWVMHVLRHTYLWGNFSLLRFFVVALIIELILSAFFVTFTVGGGTTSSTNTYYTDSSGEVKGSRHTVTSTHRQPGFRFRR